MRLRRARSTGQRIWRVSDVCLGTPDGLANRLNNQIVIETNDPGEGYELTINSPINVREAPKKAPQRAPDIGAYTTNVLQAAGFSEAEVQALLRDGVVHQAPVD